MDSRSALFPAVAPEIERKTCRCAPNDGFGTDVEPPLVSAATFGGIITSRCKLGKHAQPKRALADNGQLTLRSINALAQFIALLLVGARLVKS